MTPQQAIAEAVEFKGGPSALAALIGVKPPTVHQWLNGDRPIPAARAVQIEKAVEGRISRNLLCPKFPWDSH